MGKEIMASQAENLWTIGTVGLTPHPVVAANNLGNLPENAFFGWDHLWGIYRHPEQLYFKQG